MIDTTSKKSTRIGQSTTPGGVYNYLNKSQNIMPEKFGDVLTLSISEQPRYSRVAPSYTQGYHMHVSMYTCEFC